MRQDSLYDLQTSTPSTYQHQLNPRTAGTIPRLANPRGTQPSLHRPRTYNPAQFATHPPNPLPRQNGNLAASYQRPHGTTTTEPHKPKNATSIPPHLSSSPSPPLQSFSNLFPFPPLRRGTSPKSFFIRKHLRAPAPLRSATTRTPPRSPSPPRRPPPTSSATSAARGTSGRTSGPCTNPRTSTTTMCGGRSWRR